jgi:hypothetical protein
VVSGHFRFTGAPGCKGEPTDTPNPGTPLWASLGSTGPKGRCATSPLVCMPGHGRGLRPARPPQTVNPGTRISFGHNFRTVAESCNAASAGPGCRSSGASVSNDLMTAIEQQPGYFSHSDAAAGLVDRFPYRQTLIGSHRP